MAHNWYINQDVVCIKSFEFTPFKEGEVYTIKQIRGPLCSCPDVLFDLGFTTDMGEVYCEGCGVDGIDLGGIYWAGERYFAPSRHPYRPNRNQ